MVAARQNLRPSTTTIQCHLETGHTKNDLELSTFIWSLKDQNKEFDIQ